MSYLVLKIVEWKRVASGNRVDVTDRLNMMKEFIGWQGIQVVRWWITRAKRSAGLSLEEELEESKQQQADRVTGRMMPWAPSQ